MLKLEESWVLGRKKIFPGLVGEEYFPKVSSRMHVVLCMRIVLVEFALKHIRTQVLKKEEVGVEDLLGQLLDLSFVSWMSSSIH